MKKILFILLTFFLACESEGQLINNNALLGISLDSVPHIPQELLINYQVGVMIWGQSNALGSTDGVAPTTSPIDYQAPIVGVSQYVNSTGNFNTLEYNVNSQGSLFNSNLSLGYGLYQEIDRVIFMGIEAVNGAPLFNDLTHTNFSPDAIGGLRLIDELIAVNLALKTRCALYGKTPFIISIWIGGEADSQDNTTADEIRQNYQAVKSYILANGGQIDAEIVSLLNPSYANATPSQINTVRTRLQTYCDITATAYEMDMDQFPLRSDSIHFTGPGQEQIGDFCNDLIINTIFGVGIETYPGTYSAVAKDALKNFRDDIPTGYKDAVADFVDGLDSDGILDDILICQIRAMDSITSAMVDIMGIKYAVNNGGTHDPGVGITYNGTSDFTDTGWQLDKDGSALVTLNNMGFGWYVTDNLTTATYNLGGVVGGTNPMTYILQNSGVALGWNLSGASPGASNNVETAFADGNFYSVERSASNLIRLRKAGVSVATDTDASTSLNSTKMAEAARRTSSTALTSFANVQIGLFICFSHSGMDYTALNNRITTLISDLAAL